MRESDVANLLAEPLPRPLDRVLLWMVLAGASVCAWTATIDWYVRDQSAGLTKKLRPVLQKLTTSRAPLVNPETWLASRPTVLREPLAGICG